MGLPADVENVLRSNGINTVYNVTEKFAWEIYNITKSREVTKQIENWLTARGLRYSPA